MNKKRLQEIAGIREPIHEELSSQESLDALGKIRDIVRNSIEELGKVSGIIGGLRSKISSEEYKEFESLSKEINSGVKSLGSAWRRVRKYR